ncbi:MAG: ATP-binding protein, partial [Erysipelotrichia bacterium]|nr:ATP-binding protein [Erysipelotrichia bacterium]
AAPIHDHFFFREQEIEHIDTAFQLHDIVVLHGVAGAGKTRLALHYAKTHSEKYEMKLLCILNRGLSLYEDLKKHIYRPGDYFVFIDDANELTDLKQIIEYATKKIEGYNIKILITVRDYTLTNTKNIVQEILTPKLVRVRIFTDEEIRELLRGTLGIVNRRYLDRIVTIAEGNARLAILAGEIARKENRLDSIRDVSQLYDEYFGSMLENYPLFQNDDIGIVAGIVAFLGPSTLASLYKILPTLLIDRMQEYQFLNYVRKLDNDEFLDLFHDTAVKYPDQSLSNYILKHVFFDRKLIDLSKMIKICFPSFKNKTIESVNTLLHIFTNDILIQFVIGEIRKCWDELTRENSPDLPEFIKSFFSANPTITLIILKEKIESVKEICLSPEEIDVNRGRNIQSVTNDIIDVLGGFARLEQNHIALDLFIDFYLKRPDLYTDFFRALDLHFSIDEDSVYNEFSAQITLLEKVKNTFYNLKDLRDDRKLEYVTVLFFEIAKSHLKLSFQTVKSDHKGTATFARFSVPSNEATNSYRGLIWDFLIELSSFATYREGVRSVLISYGDAYCENNPEVTQYDAFFINEIILTHFPKEELRNCLLAEKICRYFERENVSY